MVKVFYLVFFLMLARGVYVNAQSAACPPVNIGFESGSFANWSCDTGRIDFQGDLNLTPSAAVVDWQTIYSSYSYPQIDPYGGFPTLCPYGGKYSIKLGNDSIHKRADRISYTFNVPTGANTYDLIFYYAVVLQNPPHLDFQQPRFTVKTFDVTDNTYVDCASFNFIASASLPGFKLAPKGDTVYYKDWSPSTIHLNGLAGKQMRLEFTTNDCSLGKHFGYAYLDVNEDCGSPITGNTYCSNQNFVNLTAPGGFGNYSWFTGDLSKFIASGRVLTVSPAPPAGTKYAVVLTPFANLGCIDTLYTYLSKNDAEMVFKVTDTLRGCVGTGADLTAAAVTAGSSDNLLLSYSTDQQGLNYLPLPNLILTSGTYFIKAVNPAGCINILPVNVSIANPDFSVTDPPTAYYPATIDLSATFTHNAADSYNYYTNSEAGTVVADYRHVAYTGTYFIQATNPTGCTTIKPVNVIVRPPPGPVINAVNTFTPNNDGINDYFSVTITGFGAFGSLNVYSRYGELVFETKSIDTRWDGRFNGVAAPAGTYYWLFTGNNTYDHSKISKSGFIALIR